jgi:hypothetical protein
VNRIDHLIYAALDLESGVRDIEERFGVRAGPRRTTRRSGHPQRAAGAGPTAYLEVIAPDPGQAEPPGPRPYGVDGIRHNGPVGWAIACDDIDDSLEAARAAGFDPGEVIDGHRLTASGTMLGWRVTANAGPAGVIPFLIQWTDSAHRAKAAPVGLGLESLHIEHPDSNRSSCRCAPWARTPAPTRTQAIDCGTPPHDRKWEQDQRYSHLRC